MAVVFIVSIPTVDYEQLVRNKKPKLHENDLSRNRLEVSQCHHALQRFQKLKPTRFILEEVLELHKIKRVTWRKSSNGRYHQVVFQIDSQSRVEQILDVLHINVIQNSPESTVRVVPCTIYYERGGAQDYHSGSASYSSNEEPTVIRQINEFVRSIKARLTIAQVVDGVRAGGDLNFDFLLRIVVAGLIASIGLMDDNVLFFVASMLLCPLMGPIMALSFGVMIKDRKLTRMGIRNELIGVVITTLMGFILGLFFGPWQEVWQKGPWPTDEMEEMGILINLWVGALVAVPCGAGIALALLRDNVSSLVGVAIASSLLPPCVNTGILWANSAIMGMKAIGEINITTNFIDPKTGKPAEMSLKPSYYSPEGYDEHYSFNHAVECLILGAVSLVLAFVNIFFIILTALMVLKIKEVAPRSNNQPLSRFWTEDIKIARDYNKNMEDRKTSNVDETLMMQEWAHLNGIQASPQPSMKTQKKMMKLANIMQEAEHDIVYQTVVRTTSPRLAAKPHHVKP